MGWIILRSLQYLQKNDKLRPINSQTHESHLLPCAQPLVVPYLCPRGLFPACSVTMDLLWSEPPENFSSPSGLLLYLFHWGLTAWPSLFLPWVFSSTPRYAYILYLLFYPRWIIVYIEFPFLNHSAISVSWLDPDRKRWNPGLAQVQTLSKPSETFIVATVLSSVLAFFWLDIKQYFFFFFFTAYLFFPERHYILSTIFTTV